MSKARDNIKQRLSELQSIVGNSDLSDDLKRLLIILIIDDDAVSKAVMGLEEKVKDMDIRLNDPDAYKRRWNPY